LIIGYRFSEVGHWEGVPNWSPLSRDIKTPPVAEASPGFGAGAQN